MRIALIYAGHLRSFPRIARTHRIRIDSLRKNHEVDVFMHTWGAGGAAGLFPWQGRLEDAPLSPLQIESLRLLAPRDLMIENSDQPVAELDFPIGVFGGETEQLMRRNMSSFWASIGKAWALAKKHESRSDFRYDAVVRTRPDVDWPIQKEVDIFEISRKSRFPDWPASKKTPSDLAFIASRDDADAIFDFHSRVKPYLPELRGRQYRLLVPEIMLGDYLELEGIDWDGMTSNVLIVRDGPGSTQLVRDSRLGTLSILGAKYSRSAGYREELPARGIDPLFAVDIAFNLSANPTSLAVTLGPELIHLSRANPSHCLVKIRASVRRSDLSKAEEFFIARVWFEAWRNSGWKLQFLDFRYLVRVLIFGLSRRLKVRAKLAKLSFVHTFLRG